jgi:glycosyltransferase involved in cell wall biosynthesis
MSSAHEGMSNAMLEAMASGLPIVTTRCEGVEELVDDNGVVTETSSESICDAIYRLWGDKDKYSAMSQASREKALKFSWNEVAGQYIKLYEKLIQSKY